MTMATRILSRLKRIWTSIFPDKQVELVRQIEHLKERNDVLQGLGAIKRLVHLLNRLDVTEMDEYKLLDIWPDHQEYYYKLLRKRVADAKSRRSLEASESTERKRS